MTTTDNLPLSSLDYVGALPTEREAYDAEQGGDTPVILSMTWLQIYIEDEGLEPADVEPTAEWLAETAANDYAIDGPREIDPNEREQMLAHLVTFTAPRDPAASLLVPPCVTGEARGILPAWMDDAALTLADLPALPMGMEWHVIDLGAWVSYTGSPEAIASVFDLGADMLTGATQWAAVVHGGSTFIAADEPFMEPCAALVWTAWRVAVR